MRLPADYFARLYAGSQDPWGFRTRWYEQRKRDLTLACLDRPRYRRGFEPGCSLGLLTTALASRCDELLATDIDRTAVAAARTHLAGAAHVRVEQGAMPDDWPDGTFDLVVVSEVGYYLDENELDHLARRTMGSLEPGGTLLLCHWRHPVDDCPTSGDAVHERFRAVAGLCSVLHHLEEDLRIDVLSRGPVPSPARREGLTP